MLIPLQTVLQEELAFCGVLHGSLARVTGAGFTWLRYGTGSVVAPIALHWALNLVGALVEAAAWQMVRARRR